jgi:hypothetical protein
MELDPIPQAVKIASKTPCLVLKIETNHTWYLVICSILCLLCISLVFKRSIALFARFSIEDGLWLISLICLSAWYLYIFWNVEMGLKCGVTELRLDERTLTIDKKLFGLSKTERIDRLDIQSFYQLKDKFSKPSWGLKVKTNRGKRIELVSCKPIAVSNWLGSLLAETYRVNFIPSDYQI